MGGFRTLSLVLIVGVSIILPSVVGTADDPFMSYDFLYNEAVEKYLAEDWEGCIKYIEMALDDWHWWQGSIIGCRKKCTEESSAEKLFSEFLTDEDRFFEKSVRNTLCLVKCKKDVFGSRMDRVAEGHVDEDFEIRKPYDYLQLCYYRVGNHKEAADAAATVLAKQPEHEVMKNNLKYYLAEGNIKPETVINRELKDYGKNYILGNNAYNDNEYGKTIDLMEKSLTSYHKVEDDCRHLCEKPFDQGWFPDFISSIANHYTYTLRCKRRCGWELGNLYGEPIENFYASYFNYLQYSYYQEGLYAKAAEAIASALVLDPKDESQLSNKEFYLKGEVTEDMFIPRQEVVEYKQRLDYEKEMMEFIETSFLFLSDNEYLEDVDDAAQNTSKELRAKRLTEKARALKKEVEENQFKNISQVGIQVTMREQELGGRNRVVADGFARHLECMVLTELIKLASEENSGYKGGNPHTSSERFLGVTLGRTGLMVHAKLIGIELLELILDVTDHCRDYIQQYFRLKKPLFFSFTHLVCRTARPDKSANRSASDLSHEIHADNCILQESGVCLRIPPAYTFRDYSAILYLNEDFKGGEFVFTRDRTGATHEGMVQPKCGRMVAFSAGPENLHGVLPVTEGSRCAIGLWFTHNEKHKEIERSLAELLLKKLE
ncbi:prolyl 3-hydroxylase 1-like isoform X2 [Palaemon carinicauda]|uniref:prolyl 3-hydroxylase 1-like isoform X2 n=1 Tax=Palaemon carinicauda TaxID=392227 RepID=UPI0035B5D5F6